MKDAMLVLEQLSRFHAASYQFIDEFPGGGLDKFKEVYSLFNHDKWLPSGGENDKLVDAMYLNMWHTLSAIVIEYSKNEGLVKKLSAMGGSDFSNHILSVMKPKEGGFNCLIHSDAWCNNFMFK
jgi:hypothetical protein